jgi:hypothetical protein
MDEPFGALDPLTRDALSDDFRELHRKLGLTTVMITHDMTGSHSARRPDRGDARRKLLAQGTPSELAESGDAYVGELLRTPRRQAERLGALLPARDQRMNLFLRSALGGGAWPPARLSRQPRPVSVTALALGCSSACPRDCGTQSSSSAWRAARARQHRADGAGTALLALFYPLLLALAALSPVVVRRRLLRLRFFACGAGAGALFDAAGAAQHHHRPAGRRALRPWKPHKASA